MDKVDTGCSDVELIMEMMDGYDADSEFTLHDEVVETNQDEPYYEAKACTIMKNFKNDDYFFFLKAVLKKYNTLSLDRKEEIKKIMGIQNCEVIIKEKIVYKENKSKNNNKPKLNTRDDY
jgi:hypothetical protein